MDGMAFESSSERNTLRLQWRGTNDEEHEVEIMTM